MLSQSRQVILEQINTQLGFQVKEEDLSPATRQAITNLATVQKNLFVITELLRGENGRIERSFILRTASRMGKDSGKAERLTLSQEVSGLQAEINLKVSDLSKQVLAELNARQMGTTPPAYDRKIELIQLKCPSCGAALPIPTSRFTTCQYCKATLTIQDVSSQIKSLIQSL